MALGAGLVLGVLERIEEHAWLQAAGWIGLVVAGMGLRLVPRLGGRPPLPVAVPLTVLVLLAIGLLVRPVYAAGAALLVVALAYSLASGRRAGAWWLAVAAGLAWWLRVAWLVLAGAPVDAVGWALVAGVGLSFAWAIQSRMVHVFFGRPARAGWVVALLVLFEAGLVLAPPLAGAAIVALTAVAGALRGGGHRMSARARAAAPGIVLANRLGALGGVLLLLSPLPGLAWARDAALHVLGLGMLSVLIVAMAIVLAPVFALERAARPRLGPERIAPWLLAAATLLRAAASYRLWEPLLAVAGVLAWLGLALFAYALVRAIVTAPRTRAQLLG